MKRQKSYILKRYIYILTISLCHCKVFDILRQDKLKKFIINISDKVEHIINAHYFL